MAQQKIEQQDYDEEADKSTVTPAPPRSKSPAAATQDQDDKEN